LLNYYGITLDDSYFSMYLVCSHCSVYKVVCTVEPLCNGHHWGQHFVHYIGGFRYISGRRGMRIRAVEYNVFAFSELYVGRES